MACAIEAAAAAAGAEGEEAAMAFKEGGRGDER